MPFRARLRTLDVSELLNFIINTPIFRGGEKQQGGKSSKMNNGKGGKDIA